MMCCRWRRNNNSYTVNDVVDNKNTDKRKADSNIQKNVDDKQQNDIVEVTSLPSVEEGSSPVISATEEAVVQLSTQRDEPRRLSTHDDDDTNDDLEIATLPVRRSRHQEVDVEKEKMREKRSIPRLEDDEHRYFDNEEELLDLSRPRLHLERNDSLDREHHSVADREADDNEETGTLDSEASDNDHQPRFETFPEHQNDYVYTEEEHHHRDSSDLKSPQKLDRLDDDDEENVDE